MRACRNNTAPRPPLRGTNLCLHRFQTATCSYMRSRIDEEIDNYSITTYFFENSFFCAWSDDRTSLRPAITVYSPYVREERFKEIVRRWARVISSPGGTNPITGSDAEHTTRTTALKGWRVGD